MTRQQSTFMLCLLLMVVGGVVGGGPTAPWVSMIVEVIACALLGMALIGLLNDEGSRDVWPAVIFLVLIAAVPLAQLISLPASWWRALPGHAVPDAISVLAGQSTLARPLSLDPVQTEMRALSFIVPAAMFLGTLQLRLRARDRMISAIVLFALASMVLGMLQVTTGGPYLFAQSHFGLPIGFFANRNHQANLMLIAIPLSAQAVAVMPVKNTAKRALLPCLVLLFTIAVIATQSRAALSILPVAYIGALLISTRGAPTRQILWGMIAIALIAAVAATLLIFTSIGHHALLRFHDVGDDSRYQFWRVTILAAKDFWPSGSGLGTFVPVFNMFDDLDHVNSTWVNHAHNDYLELLLEAGLPALLLMIAYVVLVVWRLMVKMPDQGRNQKLVGLTGILIVLFHSLTDYPLRTFVILTTFAFLNGLLFAPRDAGRFRTKGPHVATPPPGFAEAGR